MLPGVEIFPLPSIVAVAAGVWRVVVPPPVTNAVGVRDPLLTTVTVPAPPPPPEFNCCVQVFVAVHS
jgi:hypothetical protein